MMWVSAKLWIFFPFIPPLFFPVVFLIFCLCGCWFGQFIHTSLSKQTWHLFFIMRSRSFGFGGSCFNCGRSRHRASKCPNKEDF
jgi:hypothetical protein